MSGATTIEEPTEALSRSYRLEGLPPEAFYIPDFLTAYEEEYLLKRIGESPQPKWKTMSAGRRVQYLGGSLTKKNVLVSEQLPSWITEFPKLVERIERAVSNLEDRGLDNSAQDGNSGQAKRPWAPNHVLINEYESGQGIAPHEDGPAYAPIIATVSLGSSQALEIFQYLSESDPSPPLTGSKRHEVFGDASARLEQAGTSPELGVQEGSIKQASGKPIATTPMGCIYLEPRSLLIVRKALYETHLHGIDHAREDIFEVGKAASEKGSNEESQPADGPIRIRSIPVANAANLSSELQQRLRERHPDGLHVARGTRVSMTFRQVDKIFQGNLPGRLVKGSSTR